MGVICFAPRLSYIFLCAAPILVVAAAGVRTLRVSGLYQTMGIVLFAAISIAVWTLGGHAIRTDALERRQLAFGGALLIVPFAIVALFWVGLGTPWEATVKENQMRYIVLIAMAIAEVGGFLMIREALVKAGEGFYSTLLLAAIVLAGPLYLVWDSFMFGAWVAREQAGTLPAAFVSLDQVLDIVLFIAGLLTYIATAALSMSLGRVQWLGLWASRIFVGLNIVAMIFLANRGLRFFSPAELAAPWYAVPGFVVGIPAVPFIIPFVLGVVLLQRAGDVDR